VPEPTQVPTPKPTRAPLAAEQLDVPFADDMQGLEELYTQTFDDADWNEDGTVTVVHPDLVEINGEMLFTTFQDGAYKKGWATLAFPFDMDFDVYEQIEISMDLQTNGQIAHKSLFGFFVPDLSKLPDRTGRGLWITPSCIGKVFFLGQTPVGAPIDKGHWGKNGGFASVSTVEAFSEVMEKITFVARRDKITGYVTKTDNTQHKLFSVEIGDTELVIYDGNGTEVFRGSNDGEYMRGYGFKIMSHDAVTIIDNIVVKAY
jgi:hypothetical protein